MNAGGILRVLLFVAVLLQVVLCRNKGAKGCKNPTTPSQLEQCIQDGINQLLNKRNADWGWNDPIVAEAVTAIQLAQDNWYRKNNLNSYITVKEMYLQLLSALSQDANLTSTQWSRGKLAYYVISLLSVCENPRDFYKHNLVTVLDNHLVVSSSYLNNNKFAYALIVLALCKAKEPVDDQYLQEISTTPGNYTFGVDEAAMVYMAYRCAGNYSNKADAAINYILSKQDSNGLFGNEYSSALAVQAIYASGNKTLQQKTKKAITFLGQSIDSSKKPFPSLLLSVLPAIAMKSFLDVGKKCPKVPVTTTTTTPTTPQFTIGITVFNNLTSNFDQSWTVAIHAGQTLFDALTILQSVDPTFSFTSQSTTWGQFITSVCNMTASADDRQYWQLLDSNDVPLQTGASQTFPSPGDSYTLKLTTW